MMSSPPLRALLRAVSELTPKHRLALAKSAHGLMARVARRCAVDPALVSRVIRGRDTSRRVTKAIDKELAKELKRQHDRVRNGANQNGTSEH